MAGHSSCPRVITGVLQDECIELVDGWRKRVNA
jgi:hypothetical protein